MKLDKNILEKLVSEAIDEIQIDPSAAYEEDNLEPGFIGEFAMAELKKTHGLEPKDILNLTNIKQKDPKTLEKRSLLTDTRLLPEYVYYTGINTMNYPCFVQYTEEEEIESFLWYSSDLQILSMKIGVWDNITSEDDYPNLKIVDWAIAEQEMRGKGFAYACYKTLIVNFDYILMSDSTQTPGSQAVWQKFLKDPDLVSLLQYPIDPDIGVHDMNNQEYSQVYMDEEDEIHSEVGNPWVGVEEFNDWMSDNFPMPAVPRYDPNRNRPTAMNPEYRRQLDKRRVAIKSSPEYEMMMRATKSKVYVYSKRKNPGPNPYRRKGEVVNIPNNLSDDMLEEIMSLGDDEVESGDESYYDSEPRQIKVSTDELYSPKLIKRLTSYKQNDGEFLMIRFNKGLAVRSAGGTELKRRLFEFPEDVYYTGVTTMGYPCFVDYSNAVAGSKLKFYWTDEDIDKTVMEINCWHPEDAQHKLLRVIDWAVASEEIRGKGVAYACYRTLVTKFNYILMSDKTQTRGSEALWRKFVKDSELTTLLEYPEDPYTSRGGGKRKYSSLEVGDEGGVQSDVGDPWISPEEIELVAQAYFGGLDRFETNSFGHTAENPEWRRKMEQKDKDPDMIQIAQVEESRIFVHSKDHKRGQEVIPSRSPRPDLQSKAKEWWENNKNTDRAKLFLPVLNTRLFKKPSKDSGFLSRAAARMNLAEGGNVFVGKTTDIPKDFIPPTLDRYFAELERIFPKHKEKFRTFEPVGSVGKKAMSGDIDLAIDLKKMFTDGEVDAEELLSWNVNPKAWEERFVKMKKRARSRSDAQVAWRAFLIELAMYMNEASNLIVADLKKVTPGNIFTLFPQYDKDGIMQDLGVQIDWMVGNFDWLTFSYFSDYAPEDEPLIKGLHRTQLILSMFEAKNHSFSHTEGVTNKETGEVVVTTSEGALLLLSKLFNAKIGRENTNNFASLYNWMSANVEEEVRNDIYDIYLKILNFTKSAKYKDKETGEIKHCGYIPVVLENYWIENMERLQLSGKYICFEANEKIWDAMKMQGNLSENKMLERINTLDSGKRFFNNILREVKSSDRRSPVTEAELKQLIKWGGLKGKMEFLGSGSRGVAYKFKNKVLKITEDTQEAEACALITGKNHPNVYTVLKVGRRSSQFQKEKLPNMPWVIIYEFLDYPNKAMVDVTQLMYHKIRKSDAHYKWDKSYRDKFMKLTKQFIKTIKKDPEILGSPVGKWSSIEQKLKIVSVKLGWNKLESFLFKEYWTLSVGMYNDTLNSVEKAESHSYKLATDIKLKYFHQLALGLTFLKKNGITFTDLVNTNVMEKNDQVAIIDIGKSNIAKRAKIKSI